MGIIQIKGFICERCRHTWSQRERLKQTLPIVCPSCKSPYWNTKRKNKSKKK